MPEAGSWASTPPAALAAIDRACREWGFFQVTGHGIEPALLRNIFEVSREFFAQPAEEKRRIRRDAENPWGYYDKELTKNRRDCKEIYDFGPADGAMLKPRWPAGYLRLRRSGHRYGCRHRYRC